MRDMDRAVTPLAGVFILGIMALSLLIILIISVLESEPELIGWTSAGFIAVVVVLIASWRRRDSRRNRRNRL